MGPYKTTQSAAALFYLGGAAVDATVDETSTAAPHNVGTWRWGRRLIFLFYPGAAVDERQGRRGILVLTHMRGL